MPGVLIVEALGQASGILVLNSLPNPGNNLVYFMSFNNVKFRKPVVPGDQLYLEAELVTKKSKYFSIKGSAYVDGNLVAEAEFMGAVIEKENQQPK
jgi:3-hydroxymyristoyl/3-hydroxydecanoyl-(acyl carrier protein) dehydratase